MMHQCTVGIYFASRAQVLLMRQLEDTYDSYDCHGNVEAFFAPLNNVTYAH